MGNFSHQKSWQVDIIMCLEVFDAMNAYNAITIGK